QLVLNVDGSFQVTYNGLGIIEPDNRTLYVGYNSGRADATSQAVDFSGVPIDGGNTDILFELFQPMEPYPVVNEIALFNKFYETHDDIFDQVVLFTNFTSDIATFAGAFHLGIRNSVEGINRSIYDNTSDYGSAGRLKSYLNMNELNIWPEDPAQRNSPFGDNNNFLTIMGQEAGHLWNSFLRFDKGDGPSDLLLGRALAHWSSFTGFEVSSTMGGGNNWIELSPGIFEVDAIIDYYSNLDQYAIGLRAPEEVPPFFYIASLSNNVIATRSEDTFIPGTDATGTRVEVTIEDIIAAEGPRIPSRDLAQKDYQQAFILFAQQDAPPSQDSIDKLQRFIDAWKDYWNAATDGRSTMSANLDAVLDVAGVEGIIADAVTSQPVDKLIIENLTTGVTQTVAAGGYYSWRTLSDSLGEPDGSFTHVIIGYPFIPDTLVIPTNFGITNTQNINLTRLPSGTLTGTVRVSKSGAPVEARIVVHIFNKLAGFLDVEVSTDNAGVYTFPELYASVPGKNRYDGVTVYPDFPGVKKEFDGFTIDAGVNHTLDFEVNPIDLLVVNDDPDGNYGNYYKTALNNLNVKYHHWVNAERGIAPVLAAATETVYPIIIWYTGNDAINSINIEEEAKLIEFLDAGGRLFLTGQNIVENLPETSVLLTDYLRVSHGGNSSVLSLIEVSNNPVTLGDASYTIKGSLGADNQTSADIFIPTGPVFDVMTYGVRKPDLGAVAVETETFKIFLTGFGFEAVNASTSSFTSSTQLMLRVLNWFGASVVISVEDEIISSSPKEFSLSQNYPNPFNPSTSISYSISQNATIKLTIYNVLGQKVFTLVDEQKSSGAYTVKWDGRNAAGSRVASGLYFYRLEAKHEVNGRQRVFVDANKMLLLQ
ncbi:MAG: T9SS type A sorting domain-containing protein, partial [Candidatus Marinimicrobia bacterium]|nr:T9SS type A sorting domain-containing protein [Candidatus Neomarinimicrobiota bacterium]